MTVAGTSDPTRLSYSDYAEAIEAYFDEEWTDGLPVVPPVPGRVAEFLESAGLIADEVVALFPERGSRVTAEKLAVNAVMAGCRPSYMRVLVAAIQAAADERFKFNHLASLGSPWPLIVVSGPIAEEIGLHSGGYLFGHGPQSRANATIARAFSLTLSNCAQARNSGIQRGQWGNPLRLVGCFGEAPIAGWSSIGEELGFEPGSDLVTLISSYPGTPHPVTTFVHTPERILDAACRAMVDFGGERLVRGVYTLLVSPHHAEIFQAEGWSRTDVRDYIKQHAVTTVGELRARHVWGSTVESAQQESANADGFPAQTPVRLFFHNGDLEQFISLPPDVEDRTLDAHVVVAGGNAGHRTALVVPYATSSNPVTRHILTS